jgi:hypothetical protein
MSLISINDSSLSTKEDQFLIMKNSMNDLVKKWTEKAQTSCVTDDERAIYYECAEELHNLEK